MRQSKEKRGRLWLWLSMGGFLLASISFLLMPIETMSVLPGLLFWIGLLIGVAFQIALEARRRAFFARYNVKREKMQKPRNGLLTFASNKLATIVDNIFVVSIVATILAFIFTKGTGYLCYVCISVLLLSFCLHCVLNGRNYFHANNQNRVRQVLEQKKATTIDKGEGDNEKK